MAMTSHKGDTLVKQKKYEEAKAVFWEIATEIVGRDVQLPSIHGIGGDAVKNELYTDLAPWKRADLEACCNGLAKCCMAENDIETALAWFEEVQLLYQNTYYKTDQPLYDWFDHYIDFPQLTQQRVIALTGSASILHDLGNTATSSQRRWTATSTTKSLPPPHLTPAVKAMTKMEIVLDSVQLRNPDPQLCNKLELTHPRLQLLGSWKKLPVSEGPKHVMARLRFASFIWNSRLYVFGGTKGGFEGPFYRDMWCLDLENLDAGWRELPSYPVSLSRSGPCISWGMVVQEDEKRTYLITGRPDVDYFDLVNEKWGSVQTTFTTTPEDRACGVKNNWPYRGQEIRDATMQIVGFKIYVFGGRHNDTRIGCNLFMELDLETKKWRRLSGYVMPPPNGDYSCPNPRVSASSWIGPDKSKFYLMFGQCDREGARLTGELHGANVGFAFNDFWSWDIKAQKWRRERFTGNPPSQRSEMACTYNEKLNRVIVFGGYSPSIPTIYMPTKQRFDYTYYADTFAYEYPEEPSSEIIVDTSPTQSQPLFSTSYPKWQHVLARGFPTYRCQAQLSSDKMTGKTYLFGGFTNTDYVPSRKNTITRAFGDVWQLRLDVPGGDFDKVDIEEEARTAKVGPWQRCFTCGNSGRWRRCAGSCGGRAFFCGTECQREGWKEHKTVHKCRKL